MNIRLFIIFLSLIALSLDVFPQTKIESGTPFITNYTADEYGASIQNWGAIEDNRGVLYVANTGGILEYDGVTWNIIPLSNNGKAKSFDKDNAGRVYVGGSGDFGYISVSKTGKTQFASLTHLLDTSVKHLDEVWKTHCINNLVYFVTYKKTFIYNKSKNSIIVKKFRMAPSFSFKANNHIFYNIHEGGIGIIDKEKTIELPYTNKYFNQKKSVFIQGYNKESLIILNENNDLMVYNYKKVKPFAKNNAPENQVIKKIPISFSQYLKEKWVYNFEKLKDNKYALGFVFGGVVIINDQGEILKIINKEKGLNDNAVLGIYQNKQNNLWLLLNNGVSFVELGIPISCHTEKHNINNIVLSMNKHNNKYYAGTMEGILCLEKPTLENTKYFDEFKNTNNTKGSSVWSFCNLGNNLYSNINRDSKSELIKITDNNSRSVIETGVAYKLLPYNENTILLGFTNGLGFVRFDKNKKANFTKVRNINYAIRDILITPDSSIWLAGEHDGLYKIPSTEKLDTHILYEKYDTLQGLLNKSYNYLHYIDNELVLACPYGIQKAINTQNNKHKFIRDSSYADIFVKDSLEVSQIKKLKDSTYIIKTTIGLGIVNKNESNRKFKQGFLKRMPKPYRMMVENDSTVWAYGKSGIFRCNISNIYKPRDKFHTLLRKITAGKDSILLNGNFYNKNNMQICAEQDTTEKVILPYSMNSIRFNFAAVQFIKNKETNYQYILKGFDENWSKPSNKTFKEYTNLPYGEYVFMVKAENILNTKSNIAKYKFKIEPPFYLTTWAYLTYIILLVLIIILIVKLYTKRLKKANIKLENIVKERTAEIMQQKEEIQTQAEELEATNMELEKLSIVASETENSVVIANRNGEIEYVNNGFSKLYGYDFNEFVTLKGNNLFESSSNKEIKTITQNCIDTGLPQTYTSKTTRRTGECIWVQTTLSPIFDDDDKVIRIVAIDTDITKIKEVEEEIKKKNKNITDSINYAQRIQTAVLPDASQLSNYFSEYFIFFKPRDIVSGDFYWMLEKDNFLYLAVADCTGHGVPGAFMSMIGNTLLNEIVLSKNILSPAKILNELNINVINLLKSNEDAESQNDGMDISLLKYSKSNNEIVFSAANHNAFIIKNNEAEVIKGSIFSIGEPRSIKKNLKFKETKINVNSETSFYMFTDGMPDQIGGPENKKYSSKKLRKLIQSIHEKSLSEQKQIIEYDFDAWAKSYKQLDDILVTGIKF